TVMWQDRLTIRSARPLARGRIRFIERPSLTKTVETRRSSTSAPSLCSALAMADSSTFLINSAAFLLLKVRRFSASSTFLPRIWSATKRAFWAEMRAPDNFAATSIILPLSVCLSCLLRDPCKYGSQQTRLTYGQPCLHRSALERAGDRCEQRWSNQPFAAESLNDVTRFSLAYGRWFLPQSQPS